MAAISAFNAPCALGSAVSEVFPPEPAAVEPAPAVSWVSMSAQGFVSAAAVFEPFAAAGACLLVSEPAAFEFASSWVLLAARVSVLAVAVFEPAAASKSCSSADFGVAAFEPAASWVLISAHAFVLAAAVFEPSAAAGACLLVVAVGEPAAFELAAFWVLFAATVSLLSVAVF